MKKQFAEATLKQLSLTRSDLVGFGLSQDAQVLNLISLNLEMTDVSVYLLKTFDQQMTDALVFKFDGLKLDFKDRTSAADSKRTNDLIADLKGSYSAS